MSAPVSIIAKNLRSLLAAVTESHTSIAERAGITRQYLSQLLNEKNENPGLLQLQGLAGALGVSLAELVTDPLELGKFTKTHSVTDCLEVVRQAIGLLEGDDPAKALRYLRGKKR